MLTIVSGLTNIVLRGLSYRPEPGRLYLCLHRSAVFQHRWILVRKFSKSNKTFYFFIGSIATALSKKQIIKRPVSLAYKTDVRFSAFYGNDRKFQKMFPSEPRDAGHRDDPHRMAGERGHLRGYCCSQLTSDRKCLKSCGWSFCPQVLMPHGERTSPRI